MYAVAVSCRRSKYLYTTIKTWKRTPVSLAASSQKTGRQLMSRYRVAPASFALVFKGCRHETKQNETLRGNMTNKDIKLSPPPSPAHPCYRNS